MLGQCFSFPRGRLSLESKGIENLVNKSITVLDGRRDTLTVKAIGASRNSMRRARRLLDARIIDADGHVAEDSAAIIAHMPQAYRDKAREQPFNPFPPFDHLHAGHLVDMPPGAFNRKVGPKEWLAFLDEVGIDTTVLYPTAGVASSNIVNPDWAIDAARAYNDWLYETYLTAQPALSRVWRCCRRLLMNPQAAAEELRRAVSSSACAAR